VTKDKFEYVGCHNVECLFAYAYLWAWGFCPIQEYNNHLDKMFLKAPDDEVLLELEESSSDYKKTFARLKRYFDYETNSFDSVKFGKVLFNGLEDAYKTDMFNIAEFGKRCYDIWKLLPNFLSEDQPFWTLSYADDPLSWGDEEQSRALFEAVFCFFKE